MLLCGVASMGSSESGRVEMGFSLNPNFHQSISFHSILPPSLKILSPSLSLSLFLQQTRLAIYTHNDTI